jgi:hypothetical protein
LSPLRPVEPDTQPDQPDAQPAELLRAQRVSVARAEGWDSPRRERLALYTY